MSSRFAISQRIGRIITLMGAVFMLFIASATIPFVIGNGISFAVPPSPTETHSAGTLYINTSFTVENHCPYAVRQMYYTLNLSLLSNGTEIYSYSTHLAAALPGKMEHYVISVPISVSALPSWFVSAALSAPVNMSVGTSISASYAYGFFQFGLNFKGPFSSSSIMKPAALAGGQPLPVCASSITLLQMCKHRGVAA